MIQSIIDFMLRAKIANLINELLKIPIIMLVIYKNKIKISGKLDLSDQP